MTIKGTEPAVPANDFRTHTHTKKQTNDVYNRDVILTVFTETLQTDQQRQIQSVSLSQQPTETSSRTPFEFEGCKIGKIKTICK